MKNKKRLICSICAVFMLVFSLILIPFSKIDSASADSISYNFVGSNIAFYTNTYDSNGIKYQGSGSAIQYFVLPVKIKHSIFKDSNNNYSIKFDFSGGFTGYQNSLGVSGSWTISYTGPNYYFIIPQWDGLNFSSNAVGSLRLWITIEDGFNCNVTSVYLEGYQSPSDAFAENVIRYIDTNGKRCYLQYSCYNDSSGDTNPFLFDNRTYFLTTSLSDNTYYQSGYSSGYSSGYNEGESVGYNNGYNEGSDNGYNTGYGEGYNEGLENGSNYSFLGLIGATIDAPIKAFRGLFNFELLGVNMVSLITGLFTLCVIVCIVKLVLGGK